IISEELNWIIEGSYGFKEGNRIYFYSSKDRIIDKISISEKIRVYIRTKDDLFYFPSFVEDIVDGHIIIGASGELYKFRRRHQYRASHEPSWCMRVEIPLPYPKGAVLSKEVVDISAGGLAFKIKSSECYFLPGTPLNSITIYKRDKKIMTTQAEVRHITPIIDGSGEENLKVGIQFKITSKSFLKGYFPGRRVEKKRNIEDYVITKSTIEHLTFIKNRTVDKNSFFSKKIFLKNKYNEELSAILDYSVKKKEKVPTLIISPALWKTKESTALLSHMVMENFLSHNKDIAVIRYDGIRSVGESFKDIKYREPERETLKMTISQAVEDIITVVDFCYNNDYFTPEKIILCTPSISAIAARKALSKYIKDLVDFWIVPMGVADLQSSLLNITGGIDHLSIIRSGKHAGVSSILGFALDMDHFFGDAERIKVVSIEDAIHDMNDINIPISWIFGSYDSWISIDSVKRLLSSSKRDDVILYEIETGHLPLNGRDAILLFSIIISNIWQFLYGHKIEILEPAQDTLRRALLDEWGSSSAK
ncbi:MAG: PilZ domain-containing protein, partial [Nitrospirae bacterium]